MFEFEIPTALVFLTHLYSGIGEEEIALFVLGWVAKSLNVGSISRLNWARMAPSYRPLFVCTMALVLAVPALTISGRTEMAVYVLDTWAIPYIGLLGVMGLAWVAAFLHERRRSAMMVAWANAWRLRTT